MVEGVCRTYGSTQDHGVNSGYMSFRPSAGLTSPPHHGRAIFADGCGKSASNDNGDNDRG
jgi:hypothetical protein